MIRYVVRCHAHLLKPKYTQSPLIRTTAKLPTLGAVNDRKYVFHFRPKPKSEKHLAFGQIPKPRVQIYVKKGGILLKFNVSDDLSN